MRNGFSLIELSIVLVILGLLTGGILTGQNLIRAAELRNVSTEYSSYQTALNTFRDKYFSIPGDFNRATDFWGTTDIVSGDGDGRIEDGSSAADESVEVFGVWEHLSVAGLVEGSYDGETEGAASGVQITENVPSSKLGGAGWTIFFRGDVSGITSVFDGSYGNAMHFGAPTANDYTSGAILSPEEAWNIDTKIDDGSPVQGKVRAMESQDSAATPPCHLGTAGAGTDSATINYALAQSGNGCGLIFRE